MKKILVISLVFVLATFFVIERKNESSNKDLPTSMISPISNQSDEKRAVFVSYIEYMSYLQGQNVKTSQTMLSKMLDNIKGLGCNMILLHVRPFSDAIYKSEIFPWSYTLTGVEGKNPGFDVLEYVVKEGHKRGIEVHAWINPFRVRNTTDISLLSDNNPAKKWINTSNIQIIDDKGIFYNPAKEEVRKLIISGIEEIIDHYDVDGIHFDDYFYPNNNIDSIDYLDYKANGGTMSLSEYRLDNINKLIKEVYTTIKKKNKKLIFGISPEGNIDNNYDTNYADTKRWASEDGYVDYLMPQIYFGFQNERRPFQETVRMWDELITAKNVSLMVALATYKIGSQDQYALSGKNEWIENSDMMKKQIQLSRNLSHYKGFALFRYGSFFDDEKQTEQVLKEKENFLGLMSKN